jgi:hypothetical protein
MFQNLKNIIIHHGKVEQKLGKIKNIDIIILDPPRNGAGKQVVNQIIDIGSLENKTTVFLIGNTTKVEDTEFYLSPIRNYDQIVVAGVVAGFTQKAWIKTDYFGNLEAGTHVLSAKSDRIGPGNECCARRCTDRRVAVSAGVSDTFGCQRVQAGRCCQFVAVTA